MGGAVFARPPAQHPNAAHLDGCCTTTNDRDCTLIWTPFHRRSVCVVRVVQVLRVKSRLHADHGVAPSQHQQLYFQLYFHQSCVNPPDFFL